MASLGHVAVGLAAGRAYVRGASAWKAMVVFSIISLLPDADVLAFKLGIPYGAPFGHRGATHSLVAAIVVGLAAGMVAAWRSWPVARTIVFVTLTAASHGFLDTLTYGGGLGCALLWPFSNARIWAPVRFIPIAPIGAGMLSARGLEVSLAEIVLFSPFWIYGLWPR